MADKDKDIQKIKSLIEIMKENGLSEIQIKHGDDKIALKRSQPQSIISQPVAAMPVVGHESAASVSAGQGEKVGETPGGEGLAEIKSPIVGTFYATPSPDSDNYVEVGSRVDPQTVVCIIEAMKVMNEIKAEISGTISEIVVTNGQAVEYGQVLFKVRPD